MVRVVGIYRELLKNEDWPLRKFELISNRTTIVVSIFNTKIDIND